MKILGAMFDSDVLLNLTAFWLYPVVSFLSKRPRH
jgi:hypothetical protein